MNLISKIQEKWIGIGEKLTLKTALTAIGLILAMTLIVVIGAIIPDRIMGEYEADYGDYDEVLIMEDISPLSFREQAQRDAINRRSKLISMLRYRSTKRLLSRNVSNEEIPELSIICDNQFGNLVKYGLLPEHTVTPFGLKNTRKLYVEDSIDTNIHYYVGMAFSLNTKQTEGIYMVVLRDEVTPAHIVVSYGDDMAQTQEMIQPYTAAVAYCKYLGIWDETYATVTVMESQRCVIQFPSLSVQVNSSEYGIEWLLSIKGDEAIHIEDFLSMELGVEYTGSAFGEIDG